MIDPAQSSVSVQVPQNEPVRVSASSVPSVEPESTDDQTSEMDNQTAEATVLAQTSLSGDDLTKIAESLAKESESIPANTTEGAVDETKLEQELLQASKTPPSTSTPSTPSVPPTPSVTTKQATQPVQSQVASPVAQPTTPIVEQPEVVTTKQAVVPLKMVQAQTEATPPKAVQAQQETTTSTSQAAPVSPPSVEATSNEPTATATTSLDAVKKPEETQGIDINKNYTNVVDVLKDVGAITQDEANQILVENVSGGLTFEQILESNKFVTEEQLTQAKSVVHKIPFVKISEYGTDPQALTQLPEGVARNYNMLPLSYDKDNNSLTVAMKDPLDLGAIDFAEQKSGLKVIAYYAMPSEIERKIAENYAQSLSTEVTAALEQTSQVAEDQSAKSDLSELSGKTIRDAPITKIVQTIVAFAMKARASDIHIEPQEQRTRVRYRIDGILTEKLILPRSVHEAVISRIKILAGLKIDEKRVPQDGRFNFVSGDQEVDLRISTLPTIHGEKVVMRLLKKDATVPALEELGLTGIALRRVQDAIKVPHGIVLVTGPTGSGKTTTLYSVLHTINTPKVNIMTLEDPVEYQMIGINQVQTNPQAGLTFASGLRSFLRQDPNIIMVGEIRDSETAELAIQASLTGHLVFSTLHTSSAAGAIPRLLDMGSEPFLLASSMTLTMAQRVVRKINEEYRESYKPDLAVIEDFKRVLGPRLDEWMKKKGIASKEDIVLYRAKKDRPQTEPEYKGRIAIFEVMPVSEKIGKLILDRKPASEMEKLAIDDGMILMKQDGYMKALEGITTIEEVLRVAEI